MGDPGEVEGFFKIVQGRVNVARIQVIDSNEPEGIINSFVKTQLL